LPFLKKKSRKSNSLEKFGSEEHALRVHLLFYNTSRRNFESFCLKMPKRCIVYGCSNVADTKKGISIYQIPFWNDNSPVAVRRRKRWLSLCSTQSRRRENGSQLARRLCAQSISLRNVLCTILKVWKSETFRDYSRYKSTFWQCEIRAHESHEAKEGTVSYYFMFIHPNSHHYIYLICESKFFLL
jgi:hypothetical protein